MKLIETLNESGIFSKLVELKYFEWLTDPIEGDLIDLEYYYNRSGNKTITPLLEKLMLRSPETYLEDVCNIIKVKFSNKWNAFYKTYINSNYDPLYNKDVTEIRTPELSKETTPNLTVQNDGSTGTNLTTSTTDYSTNDVYGFNSRLAVDESDNTGLNSETVIGDKDTNTTSNTKTTTGNEITTETGTETTSIKGYEGNVQERVKSELELRDQYNLYDMMYKDVDSLITLQMYDL